MIGAGSGRAGHEMSIVTDPVRPTRPLGNVRCALRAMEATCPSCGHIGLSIFYHLADVPVHSVRLIHSRQEALDYPRGDILLGHCRRCGFVTNIAYDPSAADYGAEYEATQAFSPTFGSFARGLAERLVEKHDIHGKHIVEIGCGQGEFLQLMCQLGDNWGIGFDPAYVRGRTDIRLTESDAGAKVKFIADYYSERYDHIRADFVCCKMTLEHIDHPYRFVRSIRRSMDRNPKATVFFQVPDAEGILRDLGFWDIYYEHCSYFTSESLTSLFERCGFEVLSLERAYDDQYLLLEARAAPTNDRARAASDETRNSADAVARYAEHHADRIARWQHTLRDLAQNGQRAAIWGAGSKGVAFLTTLRANDEVACAVDINPNKHHTFMAGTGHEIVSPEDLATYRPAMVIIMNPIYRKEIRKDLERLGLSPQVVAVTD